MSTSGRPFQSDFEIIFFDTWRKNITLPTLNTERVIEDAIGRETASAKEKKKELQRLSERINSGNKTVDKLSSLETASSSEHFDHDKLHNYITDRQNSLKTLLQEVTKKHAESIQNYVEIISLFFDTVSTQLSERRKNQTTLQECKLILIYALQQAAQDYLAFADISKLSNMSLPNLQQYTQGVLTRCDEKTWIGHSRSYQTVLGWLEKANKLYEQKFPETSIHFVVETFSWSDSAVQLEKKMEDREPFVEAIRSIRNIDITQLEQELSDTLKGFHEKVKMENEHIQNHKKLLILRNEIAELAERYNDEFLDKVTADQREMTDALERIEKFIASLNDANTQQTFQKLHKDIADRVMNSVNRIKITVDQIIKINQKVASISRLDENQSNQLKAIEEHKLTIEEFHDYIELEITEIARYQTYVSSFHQTIESCDEVNKEMNDIKAHVTEQVNGGWEAKKWRYNTLTDFQKNEHIHAHFLGERRIDVEEEEKNINRIINRITLLLISVKELQKHIICYYVEKCATWTEDDTVKINNRIQEIKSRKEDIANALQEIKIAKQEIVKTKNALIITSLCKKYVDIIQDTTFWHDKVKGGPAGGTKIQTHDRKKVTVPKGIAKMYQAIINNYPEWETNLLYANLLLSELQQIAADSLQRSPKMFGGGRARDPATRQFYTILSDLKMQPIPRGDDIHSLTDAHFQAIQAFREKAGLIARPAAAGPDLSNG